MAITRHAHAIWEGDLPSGKGHVETNSKVVNHPYSFNTRFENGPGTNPEELIGAAHAACFSMALSHMLTLGGNKPTRVTTKADVVLDKVGEGFKITKIMLTCDAIVPGIDEAKFQETAKQAKAGCPISQALAATPIELKATLAK
ncbi:MAG TPA: OsmC family protein [Phycisphaerae bacterium]|jgi:osmotically inducible protein OsmC|nr:OsmC family protein [Phycisphaerae bacterium]